MDRKTIRRYIQEAEALGLSPDGPLPPDADIAALLNGSRREPRPTPVQDQLLAFDAQLAQWAQNERVSQIQMYRLFKEAHPEIQIGKTAFKAYVSQHHRPRKVSCTVRIEAPPGQAQVD
jgi:hypothetical protein